MTLCCSYMHHISKYNCTKCQFVTTWNPTKKNYFFSITWMNPWRFYVIPKVCFPRWWPPVPWRGANKNVSQKFSLTSTYQHEILKLPSNLKKLKRSIKKTPKSWGCDVWEFFPFNPVPMWLQYMFHSRLVHQNHPCSNSSFSNDIEF